jgi:hypothetical protein
MKKLYLNPTLEFLENSIKTADIEIEWFFYSLISNTTPEYIIISQNGVYDTICKSHNIADVYLKTDTIHIDFYGKPHAYYKLLSIPDSIFHYPIIVDTSLLIKDKPIQRNIFLHESKEDWKETLWFLRL